MMGMEYTTQHVQSYRDIDIELLSVSQCVGIALGSSSLNGLSKYVSTSPMFLAIITSSASTKSYSDSGSKSKKSFVTRILFGVQVCRCRIRNIQQ